MKERFYRTLNIKYSESSRVFDLLTVQFFIGLANALVNIIAFTLFIYTFPIETMPLVYLVIAGILIFLNFAYEKLEHRFPPLQLLKYIIGFAAILLVVLWAGLSYSNKEVFIFALLVSSVLVYMVLGYAFWGLVSILFNVRESRRVFSIVGAGDIPAKLIGYVAGPLLIPFIGLGNLVWLAIISLVVGLFLFHRCIQKKSWNDVKHKSHDESDHAEEHHSKQNLLTFFLNNRLIFAISLLSLLSYNVFVLVDYTFISEVKLRFENISQLATYIAVFFAAGRIIAFVFKIIFTSRVIEKLGVIYCLLITPGVLFLFCLLFFFFGEQSNYNLFIFGLMAMLTEVLRSTMQEPVFFILFQPLKESLRLKGHLISKGYMYPPSLIIVGLSLYFLHRTGVGINIQLAVKILIINLCIWAGIIFFIRRYYLKAVHASIKKGTFNSEDAYVTDQRTISILLNKIASGEKIEVIYSLNLLEKAGYPGLNDILLNLLREDSDVSVKKYALDRLEKSGNVNIDDLRSLLHQEDDHELKQKVVYLLCRLDPVSLKSFSENISHYEYGIRKIIIINLLNQREFDFLYKAGNEINELLYSADHNERELAIEIISDVKHVQFSDAIQSLINDDVPSVKRMAITAACKLRMQYLLPDIVELLENPEDKNIVLKGLQSYGDALFEDMMKIKEPVHQIYLADFVKLAARVKGMHSTDFLLKNINNPDTGLRDKIMHALWVKEYSPNGPDEHETFEKLLNGYLGNGIEKVTDHKKIPEFNDKDVIKRSIFNEVKKDLSMALKICTLLYKKKEINRILELMEFEKHDKLYNAMEMIELLLPKKISKELNDLFDFILDPLHDKEIIQKTEVPVFYSKAIFESPLLYNQWTRAVCVFSSWKNNELNLLQRIKTQTVPEENFLVSETKLYVLEHLN